MSIIGDADIIIGADASSIGKDLRAQASSEIQAAGQALANTLRQSFNNTASRIGSDLARTFPKVTSIAQSAFQGIQSIGTTALNGVRTAVEGVQSRFAQFGERAAGAIGNVVERAMSLPGPLGAISTAAVNAFSAAVDGAKRFAQGFRDPNSAAQQHTGLLGTLGGVARTTFTSMGNAIKTGFATVAQKSFDLVKSTADKLWNSIKSGAKSAAKIAGDAISTSLSAASKAASAAIMGGVVTALTKGFQRLDGLNQADARLKGLGITAEDTARIMQGVDDAVTGTAFGMADAAQTAGILATAGVKAGEQMDGALQAVVAVAAGAGAELGEIGPIFSKIAASGKVSGQVMEQMLQRGINASGALQKELGKSAEEISAMVSSGEIDFDTFVNAINNDLTFLADSMGGTLSGMVANVGAQMGRIGAAVQKPVFDALLHAMPDVLQGFRNIATAVGEFMAPLEERLIPIAEKLGEKFKTFTEGLNSEGIGSFVKALAPLLPLLGAIVGQAGGLLSSLPVVGNLFSGLNGPIGAAMGAMVMLFAVKPDTLISGIESLLGFIGDQLPSVISKAIDMFGTLLSNFAQNLPAVLEAVGSAIEMLIPMMVEAIPTVMELIATTLATLLPNLVTTLIGLAPILINGAVQLFLGLVQGLTTAIPILLSAIIGAIPKIISALISALPQILQAGITLFTGLISALGKIIPEVITLVIEMIPQVVAELINAIPTLLESALEMFNSLVEAFVETVPELISQVLDMLPELVSTLLGFIPQLISTGIELFLTLVTAVLRALPQILTAVINMLPQIISTLISMIPELITTGVEVFLALVTAVIKALPEILGAIWDMLPEIISALIGMIPALVQAGWDLISGLARGIWDAAGMVIEAIGGVINDAIGWAKGLLGIASPSKVFAGFGRDIGDGLSDGISSMTGAVERSASGLAQSALTGFGSPSLGLTTGTGFTGALGSLANAGVPNLGPAPRLSGSGSSIGSGATTSTRTFTIEPGAIQVIGNNPEETSLEVLNRIVEELD